MLLNDCLVDRIAEETDENSCRNSRVRKRQRKQSSLSCRLQPEPAGGNAVTWASKKRLNYRVQRNPKELGTQEVSQLPSSEDIQGTRHARSISTTEFGGHPRN